MVTRDPLIDKMVKEKTPMLILDKWFLIEANKSGNCNGCYFHNKTCPIRAVNICTSNGGNIFKELENGK